MVTHVTPCNRSGAENNELHTERTNSNRQNEEVF